MTYSEQSKRKAHILLQILNVYFIMNDYGGYFHNKHQCNVIILDNFLNDLDNRPKNKPFFAPIQRAAIKHLTLGAVSASLSRS